MSFLIEFRAPLGLHFRLKIHKMRQRYLSRATPGPNWPPEARRDVPGPPKWLQNGGPRSPRAPKTGRQNSENELKVSIMKKLT